MNAFSRRGLALAIGILAALLTAPVPAAQYGNETAATGRPIMADGTTYIDQMTPTSTVAWFVFRVDSHQSYAIEATDPFGKLLDLANAVYIWGIYEGDGTTPISTISRPFDFPAPQVDSGYSQGGRMTFVNSAAARRVAVRVQKNGPAPPAAFDFAVRVVPTSLAAARWSVNGYNAYFALSNSAAVDTQPVSGSILYFNEAGVLVGSDPFSLGSNASTQIVHLNGVAIGGAVRGGVRIVHDGAPGAILAHQTLFSPGTGQFIQYPFQMLVHAYGRGGI